MTQITQSVYNCSYAPFGIISETPKSWVWFQEGRGLLYNMEMPPYFGAIISIRIDL